jgi:ubiquinone/menaquinone biosynthesis C-methylase UbiE
VGQRRSADESGGGEFKPGQQVLQAAAVYGDFSPRLARRLGDGGELLVLDVAPIQIANTRRKLAPWPAAPRPRWPISPSRWGAL